MSREGVKAAIATLGKGLPEGRELHATRNAYRSVMHGGDLLEILLSLECDLQGHKDRGYATLIRLGVTGKLGGQPPCWDVDLDGKLFYRRLIND